MAGRTARWRATAAAKCIAHWRPPSCQPCGPVQVGSPARMADASGFDCNQRLCIHRKRDSKRAGCLTRLVRLIDKLW
ncbi:hypothetical protein SORBI_3001G096450 [Sorghum bicolor]|uniref:Uncharacterized protein n=1 Tax=Sorghum bicolor TaxID=4558 RepID=A0A1Z5S502_SORBI|nr:hypothetical protein SORBI_3001G096450 [Sorghum bicolor]